MTTDLHVFDATPEPLPRLVLPGAWVDDALCAQVDPDEWFPPPGGNSHKAKAVCARCPVIAECLDYALANREEFGVWGGTSYRERTRLRSAS